MSPPSPDDASAPSVIFADWIARREGGDAEEFEAVVRRHQAQATELARMHADWQIAQRALAHAGGAAMGNDASLSNRLRARFGADVDPQVVLRGGDDRAAAVSSAVIQRLSGRSSTFGRYRLKGEIARGGMGAILKIWDEDLRRHLAMKVILGQADAPSSNARPAVEHSPTEGKQVARFLEEAQVTGQLDHPGIVPVHELGLDPEGRVYFTMKLVKGHTLKHVFDLVGERQEGWTQTKALGVLLKVCEAMAYAHDKGVIHRDLKPANIMVGKFGEVHVMDWGLARILDKQDEKDIRIREEHAPISSALRSDRDELRGADAESPLYTMDGDVVGTPAYMPPEQAAGRVSEVGPHSDVYAMGAMLYHLLAGHMPYLPKGARLNNYAIWGLVQQGPPTSIAELSPATPAELVAISDKAMARDWNQRYRDMSELAADLSAYLEHRVVAAHQTGAWAETKKWIERNKPLAASLAAAIAILVAGVIGTTTFAFDAKQQSERAVDQERIATQRAADLEVATQTAQRNERLATEKTNDVLSLSAIQELKELVERADVLWPAMPEMVPAYEAWLADARVLVDGRPADPAHGVERHPSLKDHEAKLAEIRRRAKGKAAAPSDATVPGNAKAPSDARARKDSTVPNDATAPGDATVPGEGKVPNDANASSDATVPGGETASRGARASRVASTNPLASADDSPLAFEFEDAHDRWWHAQLSQLVADLKEFSDEKTGLFSEGTSERHGWGMLKRRKEAATIGERSLSGNEAKRRWSEAVAAIAVSPKYAGTKLAPQRGFLPIGEDPASHLWEFAHLQSGAVPERDSEKKLVPMESMCLVFVLIPAGKFWMGAQKTDEHGRHFDPAADDNESPVHEVTLDAFFLSKYEMTQGQWMWLTGRNPSQYSPSTSVGDSPLTLLNPVEQVSWTESTELLSQNGLVLPTEAQWEYATRAGTDTSWWTGDDVHSLDGATNLADVFCKSHGGPSGWPYEMWLQDGFTVHAPVGSFTPNAFGLHDLAGNIWEWCRDGYGSYSLPTHAGDGERVVPNATERVYRGGSYAGPASSARSAYRDAPPPGSQLNVLGLRPAKVVTP